MTGTPTSVCRYTLQASTFQMAVLLQFNTETSWTLQQLHDFTSIQMDMLKQVSLVAALIPALHVKRALTNTFRIPFHFFPLL